MIGMPTLSILVTCLILSPVHGVSFSTIFQNNMVLQRMGSLNQAANIFGFCSDSGGMVSLVLQPDDSGKSTTENTQCSGGAFNFVISDSGSLTTHWTLTLTQGSDSRVLSNVMFGDVFVCAGSGNMQMGVSASFGDGAENSLASGYDNIRLVTIEDQQSASELSEVAIAQPWSEASDYAALGTNSWTYFSALCWEYARLTFDDNQVPLGMVVAAARDTKIEEWSSSDALSACTSYSGVSVPSANWNAMIYPILEMTISGVIWYQGMENAYSYDQANAYSCQFTSLVSDWRSKWLSASNHQTPSSFPFGFVIEGTSDNATKWLPQLRNSQTSGFGYAPNSDLPNTFMSTAIDLPDPDSPLGSQYPRNKDVVARRLYSASLGKQAPTVESITLAGNTITVAFNKYIIMVSDSEFEVSCNDGGNWHSVKNATRVSDKALQLNVKGLCSGTIDVIRYLWDQDGCVNLYCPLYDEEYFMPVNPFLLAVPYGDSAASRVLG